MIRILYQNEHFVAVEKPYGTLSQRDASGEDGLVEILTKQLGKQVYPVHRLDRPVGGVMLYAISKKGAAELSRDGAFDKTYLALIPAERSFPDSGEMQDYLYKDGAKGKSFVVKKERKGAKLARLSYEVLGEANGLALLRIRLYTGRTHQIRVQLSSRGSPLVGDGKYGSRIKSESIGLWSYRIEINAPVNTETKSFTLLPADNEAFKALLENEEIKNKLL